MYARRRPRKAATKAIRDPSASGRSLRLRARGKEWAEQRGDQLVEVRILVPEQLGEAEAALYKRLQELADDPDDQHR